MSHSIHAKTCHILLLVLVVFLLQPARLDARSETAKSGGGNPTPLTMDQKLHDVNDVVLMVSNQGPIGLDLETGNGTGYYPAYTRNNYVFGTGFWLGARYDPDDDGRLDKVFTQGYNPLGGDSEFREGSNNIRMIR